MSRTGDRKTKRWGGKFFKNQGKKKGQSFRCKRSPEFGGGGPKVLSEKEGGGNSEQKKKTLREG